MWEGALWLGRKSCEERERLEEKAIYDPLVLAALSPAAGGALLGWSENVCHRLGLAPGRVLRAFRGVCIVPCETLFAEMACPCDVGGRDI